MQLTSVLSTLLLAGAAFAVPATYDTTYDDASGSMLTVACSNGQNGLADKYPTFGSVPSFPNIGGVEGVSWNSAKCGSCWNLTFETDGTSIFVTAIDYAGNGFNIAQEALDTLTEGHAVQLGSVNVDATEVHRSYCGL